MSRLTIPVEILAGTSIEEACKEAVKLRDKLGFNVQFNFNGVLVFVCGQTVNELVANYHRDLKINPRGER